MNPELVLYWFDTTRRDIDQPDECAENMYESDRVKPLYCGACGNLVTYEGERITVAGKHNHTCTNPAGIVYHIGCFHHAPGCSRVGSSIAEHTWFSGYIWQIAICTNCGEHLGWFFRNGSAFYGLITARLVA